MVTGHLQQHCCCQGMSLSDCRDGVLLRLSLSNCRCGCVRSELCSCTELKNVSVSRVCGVSVLEYINVSGYVSVRLRDGILLKCQPVDMTVTFHIC